MKDKILNKDNLKHSVEIAKGKMEEARSAIMGMGDETFCTNPLEASELVRNNLNRLNYQIKECEKNTDEWQAHLDCLSSIVNINFNINEVHDVQHKIEDLFKKFKILIKEKEYLVDKFKLYSSPPFKSYMDAFLEYNRLLTEWNSNNSTEVSAYQVNSQFKGRSLSQINLAEKFMLNIKTNPSWKENFENTYGIKFSVQASDMANIEFTTASGAKITLTNQSASIVSDLPSENDVRALVEIFLNSVKDSTLHSCVVTGVTPETTTQIEVELARRLSADANLSSTMINGKMIGNIMLLQPVVAEENHVAPVTYSNPKL